MSDELSRTCRTCGYALLTPNYPIDAACAMCAIDNASKEGPCCGYGDIDMDNFGNVDCCDKWEPRKSHIAVTDEQFSMAVHDGRVWQVARTCGEYRGNVYETTDGTSDDIELWCEHCDIPLEDGWRHCPNCGAKVVA